MAADVVFCEHCGAANSLHARSCVFCGQAINGPDDTHVGTGGAGHIKSGEMLKQRYRILARIGQGGFGAVYKAEDSALGQRLVAVKEMSPRNLSEEEREEAVASFKREALILAGLRHEHLPRIYEQFSENDHWYLVMDYIEGETLEERFAKSRNGSLPLVMVWQLAEQLCDILEYLHTRQPPIVFRDLKPSNIIIESSGNLFLIDFGIARHFKPGQAKDTIAFGSPGYAAPEQYGKAQTSSRADIYSLGAILHQMISGDDPSLAPFRFAPLVGYDPALQILILQMLEMDERRRPPTIARVHARIRQIRGGASWSGQARQPLNQPLPPLLPPLPGSSYPSFSTLPPLPLPPNPPISALPPLPAPPNQIAPTLPPMSRLTGAYHVPPVSRPGQRQQMLMYSQPVPHNTPTSKSPLDAERAFVGLGMGMGFLIATIGFGLLLAGGANVYMNFWNGSVLVFLGAAIYFITRIRRNSPVSEARKIEARIGKIFGWAALAAGILLLLAGIGTGTAGIGIIGFLILFVESAAILWAAWVSVPNP